MATPGVGDTQREDNGAGRRTSIEKRPIVMADVDDDHDLSAFERLPDEIIEQ